MQPSGKRVDAPQFETLERRQMLAALPFHLDFGSEAGGILDKDDQGTGFPGIQPNTAGNQHQKSLIDLDTAAGVLRLTTNGTSTSGGNARGDNTLVNALQVDFDATGQAFEIRTKITGGLSAISDGYEQGGIFFGPDQDNWIKLVAIWHVGDGGSRLEFADEYSDGAGGTFSTVTNGRFFAGSWSEASTLDLRLIANPTTGVVSAWYKINGAANWSQVPHSITVPADKRAAFFSTIARAGLIQFDKSDAQNVTIVYDSFDVERQAPATGPSVRSMRPAPGATNVLRDSFVAVDLNLPNGALDPSTVGGASVYLVNNATGQVVAATVNTTGGGDAITLTPSGILAANTSYTFHITSGVKDVSGASFQQFNGSFTTGASVAESDPRIAFNRTIQASTVGIGWTGAAIGPDGKLYGVTDKGEIHRFDIASDGSLVNRTLLFSYETTTGTRRLITGLAFDTSQGVLTAYVSHGQYVDPGNDDDRTAADWTGVVTRFAGANLQNRQDVIINLPRSVYDHLNNQPVFGPDGRLYFVMASNSAMGAPDSTWGNRPERLLSGAVLAADVRGIGATPVDVKTQDGGTYDPFASGAPVTIYATGIRNGWDLVWTSAGHLFVPANGSAAGGNTPAGPGNNPPAINGVSQTQNDFLFRIVEGGYYGHPNPLRGEYVLNGGNPTAGPDPAEISQYPVGTAPPASYRGFAYDFGRNVSPNGVIQYQSGGAHFGGALDGKLLVVRYSGGDDILILDVAADGSVTKAYGGSFGMTGLTDPLDIIQDPATGNIYVVEAGFRTDGGNPNGLRISLLKPIATATTTLSSPRLINYVGGPALHFSDVFGNAQPGILQRITITNNGAGPMALPADAFSITGSGAARFSLVGAPALPATLAAGQSLNLDVLFTATAKGIVSATLTIKTNDFSEPARTIALRGLGTVGEGGSNEPSLQRILDLYQLPINVADPDPETTDYPASSFVSGSDEVTLQVLRKAGSGPVRIELLASMGTANANAFTDTSSLGWYNPASGAKSEVLRIAKTYAQTVNVTHSGSLSFDPGAGDFGLVGTFFDFGPRDVWSEDARNTWESTSGERRKVRFFPLKDVSGAVVPNAFVFTFEEFPNATDQNDIVGIIYNVQAAGSAANAQLSNADQVPFHDRLIFSRIRDLDPSFPNLVHDTGRLVITNTGGQTLTINSIGLSNAEFQITGGGTGGGPISLAPGASHTVTVKFVYNDPSARGARLRSGTLTIQSTDPDAATQAVELRGLWQSDSETGDNATSQEPNLYEVVEILGYKINVGPNLGRDHNTGTNTGGRVERIGTETLSSYWRRVDSGKPVEILQLAAWHRQTSTTNTRTRWYVQGSHASPTFLFQHDAEYSQSFLPPLNDSVLPARASFNPGTSAFGLKFDAHFSEPALNANVNDNGHAMRWWALYDRQGIRIPDAWLVGHDYVGTTFANYDYQDNIYLVFNARPVSGPTAPAGLSASGTSSGNVLSWSKNTEGNLAGYNIYRSDSPTGTFTKINGALVTSATAAVAFTDTSAPIGVIQHYRVVPVDEHGTEGAAATASATRPAGESAPSAPGGLNASVVEFNRVVLGWVDNSGNETGFRVERALGNGAFGLLASLSAGATSFTDNSVDPLTTYRYRVFAFNAAGDSASSNLITVTTPGDPSQISSPTNLRLTALEAYRVALAWDDNSGNETGFRIERAQGSGAFSLLATINAPDVTAFADTTVEPRTQYRYRVLAFNASASSGPSNILTVETPGDPTIIDPPTALAAVAPVSNQVNLSWTDNADNENAFVVERRPAASGNWEQIATVGENAQAYVDTAVNPDTAYVYRVFARNALAQSGYSNEAAVTTPSANGLISDNIGNAGGTTGVFPPGLDIDVTATGGGIGGTSDNLRFVHRLIVGDFDYRVRVESLSKGDAASAAGLMVRETVGAGARNVFLRTSGEVRLSYRDIAGGSTASSGLANPGIPVWLRLVRSGDVFTAFYGTTAGSWTQLAQVTIPMPVALRLGVAVSNVAGTSSSASFRDLGIVQEQPPAAPTNLVATVQGSQSVELGWTDASGNEAGYRVERRDAGASAWQGLVELADGTTAYTDTTVVPGGGYEYRVVAFNAAGEAPSAIVSADVPDSQPNPPINVVGEPSASRSGVELRWVGDDNVSSYRIERRQGAAGAWLELTTISGVARHLLDASAAPGQAYQYRIIAIGGSGESAPSAVTTVASGRGVSLAKPQISAEAFSSRAVRVDWNDQSEGEAAFRLQRRRASGPWLDYALVAGESTAFIDRSVSSGVLYQYRVRAEGDGVAGEWSSPIELEIPAAAQWQHVSIGGAASGSTDIRPGVHYDIVAGGSDVWGLADELGFVYRHISGDFDYAVRITALDGDEIGRMAGLMARASLDPGSRNVYVKLRDGDVHLTSRGQDGGQTLSNASVATTGLNRWVRLRRDGTTLVAYTGTSGGSWTEVGRVNIDLGTDVLLGLATSARSETGAVTARYRELTDLRSTLGLPPAPTGLSGAFQDGVVELSWSDQSGGRSGFRVQRRAAGGLWQELGFVGEGATHFIDTSPASQTLYEYRVAGETSAGIGTFSAPASIQT